MSLERGTGGKNANYGWSPREDPPEDPAVNAWLAALWAKPFTEAEYDEMRRLAASRAPRRNKKAADATSAGGQQTN